jgi:hypothetical protein
MILRAASWIVPRWARTEWLREWEAELVSAWQVSQTDGSTFAGNRLRRRCCGAFLDAAWYRCNREDLRQTSQRWSQTPSFLLVTLVSTLLLFALASSELLRMRSILLRPPYHDPQRIATVSRTGVINSSEWVIPYSWVEIWRKHEGNQVSVAAYSWKPRTSVVTVDGQRMTAASIKVENSLFQVFGVNPVLGKLEPSGTPGLANCLILSYESWRRDFSSDPGILQKKATLDGQEARIIGVLPERFWFPSNDVAVWRLADESSFSGASVGVVARLGPQMSERWVETLLQRDIENSAVEFAWDAALQVWPVQDRIRQPLIFYALALCVALPLMIPVICSGRLSLRPQSVEVARVCRWWSFFGTKSFLLLSILLAVVIELTPEPYVFPAGRTTFVVESASLWVFSIGCVFLLWWSLADQQSRCRVCLRKLALPAHIGRSGCLFLSWVGIELACPEGHGLLHITETDVCWLDPAQWTPLDESWESLFSERTEIGVFE